MQSTIAVIRETPTWTSEATQESRPHTAVHMLPFLHCLSQLCSPHAVVLMMPPDDATPMMPSLWCYSDAAGLMLSSLWCHCDAAIQTLPSWCCSPYAAVPMLPSSHCHSHIAIATLPSTGCWLHASFPTLLGPSCHPRNVILMLSTSLCKHSNALLTQAMKIVQWWWSNYEWFTLEYVMLFLLCIIIIDTN